MIKRIYNKAIMTPLSILGFLRKDYKVLFRTKKYFYLSLLLPLIMSLIYVSTLSDNVGDIKVMVCDYDDTYLTKEAMNSIKDFKIVRETEEGCIEKMEREIKKRNFLFGIVIQDDFTENVENLKQAELLVLYDNSDPSISSLVSWKVDVALIPFKERLTRELSEEIKEESSAAREKTDIILDITDVMGGSVYSKIRKNIIETDEKLERLEGLDKDYIASPIITEKKGVHKEYSLIEIGFAPLYSILSLFLILMLCSTGVIYDKKMGLLARIRASNSSVTNYIASKILFFFSLAVAQFLIILLIFFAFGARYPIDLSLIFKAILFIALTDTLVGFLVGIISDSEGVALLISLIITLPLLFLSGMFYPLEIMPIVMQWVVRLTPLSMQIFMMNQGMLFGGSIASGYFWIPIILFGICLYVVKKSRK